MVEVEVVVALSSGSGNVLMMKKVAGGLGLMEVVVVGGKRERECAWEEDLILLLQSIATMTVSV